MKQKLRSVTFELVITTKNPSSIALELIKEVLLINEVELHEIVETDERPFHHLSVFFRSELKARSLRDRIRTLKIKNISVKIKKLYKKDWFSKWKAEFKPFNLTKKIRVVPAWEKDIKGDHTKKILLRVDTGFAFGSGLHPTTRFMSRLIERTNGRFKRFMDVGTGSGILSMVAIVNGAQEVKAIDISRDAVNAANSNFQRNGFNKIKAQRGDIKVYRCNKKYDLVAANLITGDLINLKSKLLQFVKRGQYLAISGVSINNLPYLKKEFKPLPLKCLKIMRGEGWSALLFKRL